MFRDSGTVAAITTFDLPVPCLRDVEVAVTPPRASAETRLLIRQRDRWLAVQVADIVLLRADDDYVEVHTAHQRLLHTGSLTRLLAKLAPAPFQRISRSQAVNLSHVEAVRAASRQLLIRLSNGLEVSSSRRGGTALRAQLRNSARHVGGVVVE